MFPDKTPNEPDRWNWVHCQVRRPEQKEPIELIMPDMAGEAILEEVDHPHTYRVIRAFLKKCAGADGADRRRSLREGHRDHDYFTMKLLSYLTELDDDPKTGWCQRPVAMVFTKADQCEACLDDPAASRSRTPRACGSSARSGSRGTSSSPRAWPAPCGYSQTMLDGRVDVPLRVEPRGIIEPFEWLLDR